jgi:anti-anti-sigma factor
MTATMPIEGRRGAFGQVSAMELYCEEVDGDVMILVADGGLDATTAELFNHQIEQLIERGITRIILDCRRLTYVSSYGLGVLLTLHHRMARQGGDLRLAGVGGVVVQVLNATKLNTIFSIYENVSRARLAMRSG